MTWEQQAAQAAEAYAREVNGTDIPGAIRSEKEAVIWGMKWEAERSALLVKALEKLTKYCPAHRNGRHLPT